MRITNTVRALLALMVALGSINDCVVLARTQQVIRLSEKSLRARIVSKVLPTYPPAARRAALQGVVVVEMVIGTEGRSVEVEILESPSPAIADAVSRAVKQWRFRPAKLQKTPLRILGKLTFYYVISRGRAEVREPF